MASGETSTDCWRQESPERNQPHPNLEEDTHKRRFLTFLPDHVLLVQAVLMCVQVSLTLGFLRELVDHKRLEHE